MCRSLLTVPRVNIPGDQMSQQSRPVQKLGPAISRQAKMGRHSRFIKRQFNYTKSKGKPGSCWACVVVARAPVLAYHCPLWILSSPSMMNYVWTPDRRVIPVITAFNHSLGTEGGGGRGGGCMGKCWGLGEKGELIGDRGRRGKTGMHGNMWVLSASHGLGKVNF